MFRSFERVLDVLSRDSVSTVDVMKDLSETQRGLVKYIASKEDSLSKRTNKYLYTSIVNKGVTSDTSENNRS